MPPLQPYVRSAAKWGAIVGVISYLALGVLLPLLSTLLFGSSAADLNSNPGKLSLGCMGIFALLFAFSAAGFFAVREQPGAGTGVGTVAGMVAFILYTVLGAIYEPGGAIRTAGTGGVALQIIAALIPLSIAALFGWIGGWRVQQGLRRARSAMPAESAADTPAGPNLAD